MFCRPSLQFVQTARAKGLGEAMVVYKHTVRVAINPLITMLGYTFPAILSGDAITAVILNLPTTGPLLLRALEVQEDLRLPRVVRAAVALAVI